MEKTFTLQQIKTNTQNWKSEEVLQLARHFHKFETIKGQYARVNYFVMSDLDLVRLNKITVIEQLSIQLTLDGDDKKEFTFYPVICIKHSEGRDHFPLHPMTNTNTKKSSMLSDTQNSEIVPGIFKEMITKNWNDFDVNLIDDLFVALEEKSQKKVRVVEYFVTDNIVELLNKHFVGDFKTFILYPGIDMNKFQYKTMISFTPVIGLTHQTNIDANIISGHGSLELVENELFVEYLTPCPPTCPIK